MIADTDFLISLLKRDEAAMAKMRQLENEGVRIKIPAMTVLELYIGVGAALTPDEEQKVDRIINAHTIIPMDKTIAMRAGRRIGTVGAATQKRNKGDAAIGATAEVEGEKVLTRNVDDFEALRFEVETY